MSPVQPVDLRWVDDIPLLNDKQAGSLKRIIDLSRQLPDDWSGMQGRTTLQEDFGGLRFQLAYMSYALALTHVHRLPAAPGLFKEPFHNLIQKILSPDVWTYWHYVGTGMGPFNSSLGELPATWNPVERDNIMYSAYVQSMALLFHYLFRDERYAVPGALTFSYTPLFWGNGSKTFAYDENSLNNHIYWNMVERGYLGIACEPNCVFQVCNQVPILGFRFHDLVYGGVTASEVTEGYLNAWNEFGILNESGHYTMMVQEKEKVPVTIPGQPWVDFWAASLMHAWHPEFVESNYPRQLKAWAVAGSNDTLTIKTEGLSGVNATALDFGWAAVCASEVGDEESLTKFLKYADEYLQPVWNNGSYYYPRNDEPQDEFGNFTSMDPHTGNALLAYARLNVPHGMKKLYQGPLDDRHFSDPFLSEISRGHEVRRAWYERAKQSLVLTLVDGGGTDVELTLGNVDNSYVSFFKDGEPFYPEVETSENKLSLKFSYHNTCTVVVECK
jgi:hypothetical protein